MERELYMTALRVLSKYAAGEELDEMNVCRLRHAFRENSDGPIDELCCAIIRQYLSKPDARLEKSE